VVCTWYSDKHSRDTLYCPECGQRSGQFVVWREDVGGAVYEEVPGEAQLIQMPTPTQVSAQSTPAADNASIDKPPGSLFPWLARIPVAQLVAIAMLAWALVPDNPYGYYILLRFAVCGISAYLAYNCIGWGWALIAVAVVYNPIIRVHLNREIWSVVNVVTIIAFALSMWILRGAKPESNSEIL